jgi:protein ImuA
VFLMRPQDASLQSSAAPLRVQARLAGPGHISVRVLKRRGPSHDGEVLLATAPPGLAPLLQLRRSASPDHLHEAYVLDRVDSRARQPQRLKVVGH